MFSIAKNPRCMIVVAWLFAIHPRRYPAEISCREGHLLDFVVIIQDNVFDSFTREREVPKVWETVEKFDGFLHGFDIHIIHLVFVWLGVLIGVLGINDSKLDGSPHCQLEMPLAPDPMPAKTRANLERIDNRHPQKPMRHVQRGMERSGNQQRNGLPC